MAATCATLVPLTQTEVETILAQAVTQAGARGVAAVVAVSDREGNVLGVFRMTGSAADEDDAISAAGTAAYFASNEDAFTTRTAEFIIADHFPPGLSNTPGGPLFGVQFSNRVATDELGGALLTSDGNVIGRDAANNPVGEGITGLTVAGGGAGLPLFKGGCAAGGVGIVAIAADPLVLEGIAVAASDGFAAPPTVRATEILIDGIRLPYAEGVPIADGATLPFATLPGTVEPGFAPRASPPPPPSVTLTLGGVTGELREPLVAGVPTLLDSPLPDAVKLTVADVSAILGSAAQRSQRIRAAIRRPIGTAMLCFIAVVDRAGNLLGVFRTPDATLFSFDVAIQKARTAAFFSDDTHGFTTRALGFLAQGLYPPGIDLTAAGPLNGLQDALTVAGETAGGRLADGVTIFPGGVPLYKNGVMVGAVGVSGDGVDQDDLTADAGTEAGFTSADAVRCDNLAEGDLVAALETKLDDLAAVALDANVLAQITLCKSRLAASGTQGLRLPWVKHPRNPYR